MENQPTPINTDFVVCLTLQNEYTREFSHHVCKISVTPPKDGDHIIIGSAPLRLARQQLNTIDRTLEDECAVSAHLTLPLVPSYAPSLCFLLIYYTTESKGNLVQRSSSYPEISHTYTTYQAFTELIEKTQQEADEAITVTSWSFEPRNAANI